MSIFCKCNNLSMDFFREEGNCFFVVLKQAQFTALIGRLIYLERENHAWH